MMPATNSGVGMNFGMPDVCVTPVGPVPTPIPYPNMAMSATAVPFAADVFVTFVPGLNMGATAPMTLGDQPGTLSPFMGPGRYTMGNPTVMIEALPAVSLLCPTTGNNMINGLGAVLVPSVTNVFYSRAGASEGGAGLDGQAMVALAGALGSGDEPVAFESRGSVLIARVKAFARSVPARVHDALERLDDRAAALVFDLRGCPGGELTAALELSGDFLPAGSVLATAVDGDGDETVHRARPGRTRELPLFVVVDGATASAAEVFAGSLQCHRRARVVGERTVGKGTAQALHAGLAGGMRYGTAATLVLPNGEPLHGRGVEPDVAARSVDAFEVACTLAFSHDPASHDEVR